MATIESLDLATLSNNPQNIAEALEDVLVSSQGNIATLKTNAENDANHITNTLKPQAQADADTIAALVAAAPTADVLNLDLNITDVSSEFTPVSGVQMHILSAFRFAKIVFLACEFESSNSPESVSVADLFNIGASSLHPVQHTPFSVIGYEGDSAEFVRIETNGVGKLYGATNPGHAHWIATINGFYKIA